MASQSTTWSDFDHFVKVFVPKQTIPRLRMFAEKIRLYAGIDLHLRSQEKKQDLVDKVTAAFQTIRRQNNERVYVSIRRECEAIAGSARPSPTMPPPTFGGVIAPPWRSYATPAAQRYGTTAPIHNAAGVAPPGGAVPGWQQASTSASGLYSRAQTSSRAPPTLVDWKASPMWRPIKALTYAESLPDIASSESSSTRREKRIHFSLPTDVIEKLNLSKSNPRSRPLYSVRVFCASSDYYRPSNMPLAPGMTPVSNRNVPIEYPLVPDVMLDDHMVPFKERGLRGKAGSAPPLDLDKGSKGLIRIAGRMATMTFGHTGPTVGKKKELSKKFWFQIVFTEVTTIDDLLARLEQLVPTDAATELEKLRRRAAEDDDIEVGTSALSLKDPLSGMRITKPVRSSQCRHLQCFDARWWLEANKTHPQWLCPHCSKELKFEDIICDGYFLSILQAVPDSYDEVVLESTGDWHTQDNTYGTPAWLAKNASTPKPSETNGGSSAALSPDFGVSVPIKRSLSEVPSPPDKGKRRAIEILSDSDDDDDVPLTNGRSQPNGQANGSLYTPQPSVAPSASRQSSTSQPGASRPASAAPGGSRPRPSVIDLTLSSDEEDNDEDESPAQQPYFRQPDGGSSTRVVAASEPRPAQSTHSSDTSWNGTGPARTHAPPVPAPVNTNTANLVGVPRARASDWMDEYPETPLDQTTNGFY
ncbi:E3 SUMO-protein ligase pli1 [Vanrija albida]|uniref:E3 SUMO-protein ligase pli1 n=1 Tax=Vanrija albida TaxID=181172 RepID=A0ABR3Q283_9TREE